MMIYVNGHAQVCALIVLFSFFPSPDRIPGFVKCFGNAGEEQIHLGMANINKVNGPPYTDVLAANASMQNIRQ
jgi:hypothetical protein